MKRPICNSLCLEKSLRLRSDMCFVNDSTGEKEPAYFSVMMARRYAIIYTFLLYFKKRGELAWTDSVLELLGWDNTKDKRPYRMTLYRQIKTLKQDFGVEVILVRAEAQQRCGKGLSFYKLKSTGIFNRSKLLEMLRANENVFERIIKNDFINEF